MIFLSEPISDYSPPNYFTMLQTPASPEDMIIDGDIQPETFDWEENQLE